MTANRRIFLGAVAASTLTACAAGPGASAGSARTDACSADAHRTGGSGGAAGGQPSGRSVVTLGSQHLGEESIGSAVA